MNVYNAMMRESAGPPLMPAIPAFASIGVGRTKAYELLNAGAVPALKIGRSTVIREDDWARYINNLPAYRASHDRAVAA